MKQHITEKQWLELSKKEQYTFIMALVENHGFDYWKVDKIWERVTIGIMIEFLGDDYINTLSQGSHGQEYFVGINNICDELWLAAKEKLQSR